MLTVADIMTTNLQTLGPDDSVAAARQLMAEHNFRHIPVVDARGGLVGLVSQRDILAASGSSLFAESGESSADGYIALSAVMTESVQTIDSHASLRGTAMFLQQNKVGCLPVVEDGKLLAIVTDTDFVSVAINLLEQAELGEPDEVELD
jgi:CBS domain-containing protein